MNSRMFQDKMAAAKEQHAQMIKRNTDQLAQSLGIADQLIGLTYAEKLTDISIRLARLSREDAGKMSEGCISLARTAKELGI